MRVIERNVLWSLRVSLTALRLFGFWAPDQLAQSVLYRVYGFFWFMFILGTYLIIQVVDLFVIWGDLPLMTATSFLLFTNLAQATKLASVVGRARTLRAVLRAGDAALRAGRAAGGDARDIVHSCNVETCMQQLVYLCLATLTVVGWAASAEPGQLPLRAWYPYDTSRSPAYELTYAHQSGALFAVAYLNVGKDTLVTALIAQVRCRLRLVARRLRLLCANLEPSPQGMLSAAQEAAVWARLREAARQHQEALHAAELLENCFSAPIFAQFSVSVLIICVTAFQLNSQTGNFIRLFSMGTYLLNVTFQLFLYCYQGNQLLEESMDISTAAYSCEWYRCGARLRRALLLVMVRARRATRLSAGGFATLSLASYMTIVKTSYSLFTVLQQADEQE